MVAAWISFLLALAVALGFLHPVGPLPTPPPGAPQHADACSAAKADKAAGGALDPALFCK